MSSRTRFGENTLRLEDGRFSFTRKDGALGWREIGFGVATASMSGTVEEACLADPAEAEEGEALVLRGTYLDGDLEETVRLEPTGGGALAVSRSLRYVGEKPVTLHDAFCGRTAGRGGPVFGDNAVWRARFAHLDNLRTECVPWCRPEFPYVRPLPRTPAWFGDQESQAAPYLLLCNDTYGEMLLEGQLAQAHTRLRWRLAAGPRELFADYRTSWHRFSGGALLRRGETLELEPVRYEILEHTRPQDALGGYLADVTARNELRQADSILHSKAFYCSWNYGYMRDISEAKLLAVAEAIREHLPEVHHFLIDGGWIPWQDGVKGPHCGNFHLPEEEVIDRTKFPHGMGGMAEKLAALGLRPAIHWAPCVGLHTKLARDRADWLVRDADGGVFRIGNLGYLDYSLPEVRDFLKHIFETIFRRWGYAGMKMDFWSQSVESSRVRYARGGSGIEWRDWLLSTIRSYLPEDGFLMTCVATAHGNPFLGKQAQTYRCCIDVGHGDWNGHVQASCWIQPLLPFPGRTTGLLNVDGLGVNTDLTDDENLHRLTYGFITMGSLEVDGILQDLAPRHMGWLRRLTEHVDRGYPVRCPEDEPYTGAPFPRVLYVDYPESSPTRARGVAKHVALLNWENEPRWVGATAEQLGLEGTVTAREFWTDAEATFESGEIVEKLPPHGARLYEIRG